MSLFHKKNKVESVDLSRRYNLIGRVGQGSMSKVWRAEDPMNGQSIAVKVLDKEKTLRYEARFKGLHKPSEADIALSLKHPNIVRTLEVGQTTENETYLIMPFVEGCGLGLLVDLQNDRMKRYRTRYMIEIGDALAYFHKQDWIHRDICPRNIMVTEDDHIKLIDFGLTVPNTPDFRKPGNRTGTANYMAPELIKRQPTDQRIDVFSYAVTCFEMYAKRHPWDAAMTIDAVMQHINKPPVPILDLCPRMDQQIAGIIMKGLEANPGERWQNIDEMVTELRTAEARLVKVTRELLVLRKQAAAGGKQRPKTEKKAAASDAPPLKKAASEKPAAPAAKAKAPVSAAAKAGAKRSSEQKLAKKAAAAKAPVVAPPQTDSSVNASDDSDELLSLD